VPFALRVPPPPPPVPRPQAANKDLLLVLTEHYKFAVLEFTTAGTHTRDSMLHCMLLPHCMCSASLQAHWHNPPGTHTCLH
jgi:hypothetical protein